MSADIELSYFLIPEDSINGVYPFQNMEYNKVSFVDIQNSKMYRDGTMDNTQFQYMIMKFQTKYAVQKHSPHSSPNQNTTEDYKSSVISCNNKKHVEQMREVPTIQDLKQQLEIYKSQSADGGLKLSSAITPHTWNFIS